ncbi:hypothetical protein MHUMG1_07962 [Metarhizium humberi]|uniref:Uncharacterized protein n=1 Tax=Metarhizium humberi TaxID=2596975 RepID=A0A9P8S5D5_9HYPO|nr:hypothetical protein MHUMG1_07962 [Metarhizium humberi]
MVKPQRHKCKRRPPDPDDLARHVSPLHPQEARQTHEPVAADAAQENHGKPGRDLLPGRKGHHLGPVRLGRKRLPVAEYHGNHKQRPGKVAQERHQPVQQHPGPGKTPLENSNRGELDTAVSRLSVAITAEGGKAAAP